MDIPCHSPWLHVQTGRSGGLHYRIQKLIRDEEGTEDEQDEPNDCRRGERSQEGKVTRVEVYMDLRSLSLMCINYVT